MISKRTMHDICHGCNASCVGPYLKMLRYFKHQNVLQAGKFVLNGEEVDLGVGPQASMAQRVEALRVLLEQRLGLDIFMK